MWKVTQLFLNEVFSLNKCYFSWICIPERRVLTALCACLGPKVLAYYLSRLARILRHPDYDVKKSLGRDLSLKAESTVQGSLGDRMIRIYGLFLQEPIHKLNERCTDYFYQGQTWQIRWDYGKKLTKNGESWSWRDCDHDNNLVFGLSPTASCGLQCIQGGN